KRNNEAVPSKVPLDHPSVKTIINDGMFQLVMERAPKCIKFARKGDCNPVFIGICHTAYAFCINRKWYYIGLSKIAVRIINNNLYAIYNLMIKILMKLF